MQRRRPEVIDPWSGSGAIIMRTSVHRDEAGTRLEALPPQHDVRTLRAPVGSLDLPR